MAMADLETVAMRKTCFSALAALLALVATARAEPAPRFDHVYVLVLENHGFDDAIYNGPSPFLRELAEKQGLATRYFGVAHPSLPNYLALIGGDDFGIRDDRASCFASDLAPGADCNRVEGESLADQLTKAGLSWAYYGESLPEAGSLVAASPSRNAALYAQKHNPFAYFPGVAQDEKGRQAIKPYERLAADLASGAAPNFALIVPNQCHDGHGLEICHDREKLIADYDDFTRRTLEMVKASKAWTENSVFVVTFDEGARPLFAHAPVSDIVRNIGGQDNHIATIAVTACGGPARDETRYDHFALLATIEDGFGLPRLRKAQQAPSMAGLLRRPC